MEDHKHHSNYQHHGPTGAVIIFFILLFVYSKFGPSIPFSILSQQKGEPLIVQGSGKVSVAPDIAKVGLGIDQTGSSLKSVQDSVNQKSKKLVESLKKLGIDEKDIKTTSYNVYPQYDYSGVTQRITGYSVSTTYQITVKDFDKVNDLLVLATSEGANVVGGVTFEVNEETQKEKMQEAREMAVKEAKENAQGLAKASGINLGKIINISEDRNIPGLRQYSIPVAGGGGDAKEIEKPDIQPGETELSVMVYLSFEVR